MRKHLPCAHSVFYLMWETHCLLYYMDSTAINWQADSHWNTWFKGQEHKMHEKVGKLSKDSDRRIHSDPVNHTKCHYFRPFPGDRKQKDVRNPGPRALWKALELNGLQGMSARPDRLAGDGASRRGHWTRVAPKRMWNTRTGGRQENKDLWLNRVMLLGLV